LAGEEGGAETKPLEGVQVELHGRTDVGLIREHNEDSLLVLRLDDECRDIPMLRRHALGERGTLLIVCDGMGGAAAGEVASNMAVESMGVTMLDAALQPRVPDGTVDDPKTALGRKLRMAAQSANMQIFREARQNVARSGMGTTMTALLLAGNDAVIAQVGDSRAYVWRRGAITQVTRDQSLVNQLLESGHITPEQAKFFEHSNVILQALGVQEEVEVQLSQVSLRRGDRIMLCSDGLVGVVSDEEIGEVMAAIEDPEEASKVLIELANAAGGPDNITVIVARVEGAGLPEPTEADVIRYELWRIAEGPPPPPPGGRVEAPVATEEPTGQMAQIAPPAAETAAAPAEPSAATAPKASSEAASASASSKSESVDPLSPTARPTHELVSMSVIAGVIMASVVAGSVVYGRGVTCRVEAREAGLAVFADGVDTGARTLDGTLELRLPPGRHRLALAGPGAPPEGHELDVVEGGSCAVSFLAAAPTGAAPGTAVVPVPGGLSSPRDEQKPATGAKLAATGDKGAKPSSAGDKAGGKPPAAADKQPGEKTSSTGEKPAAGGEPEEKSAEKTGEKAPSAPSVVGEAAEKPAATGEKPSAAGDKPSAGSDKPSTGERPSATGEKPSATGEKSSAAGDKPSEKPAAPSGEKPAAPAGEKPSTSGAGQPESER
jgi:protein phosphatase